MPWYYYFVMYELIGYFVWFILVYFGHIWLIGLKVQKESIWAAYLDAYLKIKKA